MTVRTRLAARRELLPCHISKLPSECKAQIVDYLPARDVKNLRLASRAWKDVCVRGLFNAFDNPSHCIHGSDTVKHGVLSLRPHLKDMDRIDNISKRPDMTKHVRELEVYTGDFEKSLFLESTLFVLAESSMEDSEKKERLASVQELLDKMHWSLNHCDGFSLAPCLKHFQNLEYLRISSSDYPFCTFDLSVHMDWERMWDSDDEMIKAIQFDRSVERFRWVLLTALRRLKSPLRKLSLEMVPLNVFARGEEYHNGIGWEIAPSEFRDMGIRDLHVLTYLSPENYYKGSTHGSDLSAFINSCRGLEILDLSFQGAFMRSKSFRDEWQPSLFNNRFLHLHTIRLTDLWVSETLLSSLVSNHSVTLRRLSVIRCVLHGWFNEGDAWQSVRSLLTSFREDLQLEKLQFICADSLVGNDEIYDEEWNDIRHNCNGTNETLETEVRILRDSGEISPSISNTRLLEMFVLKFCDWPMAGEIPEKWQQWKRLPQYESPGLSDSDNVSSEDTDSDGVYEG